MRGSIPALAELAGLIGDPQVRNRGTLGGSVANNDPAADCPAGILALGDAANQQGGLDMGCLPDFLPGYHAILSSGGALSPADTAALAGIDITEPEFWQNGYDILAGLVAELKGLV